MLVVATGNRCCSMEISFSSLPGYTMNDGAVVVSIPGGGGCFGFLTVGVGDFFFGFGELEVMIGW